MIERRQFENFDWVMLLLSVSLSIVGIITIYSVTSDDPPIPDYQKQIVWIMIGLVVYFIVMLFDYKVWSKLAVPLYLLSIVLLIYLIVFGRTELGVRRWIVIPGMGFRVQPSEFAKVTLVVMLSRTFAGLRGASPSIKDLLLPGVLTGFPLLLVLLQPDLGTSLLLVPLFVSLVFVSGFSIKKSILIIILCLIPIGIVGPKFIKPYQLKRITSFLDPEADPLGSGYHLIQSKIAIGSGGFLGKGFKMGSQSHLDFLPVQDTDFIFSVWEEERGFVGGLFLLSLYLLLIARSLKAAKNARDLFGTYLCVGMTVMLFCQIFINTGMVIGLMPITGLPLPFMSYGGSSCIVNFFAVGLIANVSMRRFTDYV